MNTTTSTLAAFTLACSLLTPALAQNHADHASHGSAASASTPKAAAAADAVMTAGEITRVDKRGGKLTIRHEEIKNLDMPAMTMVFALKNPDDGASLKAGDKVRFHVEAVNGALLITQIEAAAKE